MTDNPPTRIIRWTDNGAVHSYEIEVPDEGLVVLEGPPGSGKSTMLASLEDALDETRKSRIPIRDGAPRAEVSVFGQVVLRRSLQSRRLGHLEFATLSGRFNIDDLVEPKVDKVSSRDALRIKAVLQLTSAKIDVAAFYPLVGSQEEFDAHVSSTQLGTTDAVELSARVKAALELACRNLERKVETLRVQAEAARLSANGTDVDGPCDEVTLGQAYKVALQEQSRLEAEKKAYADAETKQKESREAMDKLTREYTGLGLKDAEDNAEGRSIDYESAKSAVAALREQLRQAEIREASTKAASELADQKLETARAHTDAVSTLKTIVEADLPEPVLELDLQTAESEVKTALEAVEKGALIRKARLDLQNASNLKSEANTAESKALELREAAKSTDSVLAEAMSSLDLPLSVRDGRMVITNSDRRPDGIELFEDLSKGEKTKLVIQIAIKAVGPGGMFPIPQEFYEGLTESNILAIAQELENSGVLAVTAKAVDGETITAKVIDAFPLA